MKKLMAGLTLLAALTGCNAMSKSQLKDLDGYLQKASEAAVNTCADAKVSIDTARALIKAKIGE